MKRRSDGGDMEASRADVAGHGGSDLTDGGKTERNRIL